MSDSEDAGFSPFDSVDGSGISAHVVDDRGPEPRLHGYTLASDLGRYYGLSETLYLATVGKPPGPTQRRLFEVGLIGALHITLHDAAVHSARLSRHLAHAAKTPEIVAPTTALAVSELSREQVWSHLPLLKWLADTDAGELPEVARGSTDDAFTQALGELVSEERLADRLLGADPTSLAVSIGLIWLSGIKNPPAIVGVMSSVRIPVALAESFAVKEARVWSYPLNLPFWDYKGVREDG